MATKTRQMSNIEARRMLERDTEAFLKSGKTIEKIPSGVSGQPLMGGPKHLVIAPKPKTA